MASSSDLTAFLSNWASSAATSKLDKAKADKAWIDSMTAGAPSMAGMFAGMTPKEVSKLRKAGIKSMGSLLPMISIADSIVESHYEPVDYTDARTEAMAGYADEMRGLMKTIQAEGEISAERYKRLLTESADVAVPVARRVQDETTRMWEQALGRVDPSWRDRLKAGAEGADAYAALAQKYLSGEEASDLIATGIAQTKEAQKIASDMLAGKLPAADQRALDIRTAETVSQFGQWGNAGATMARGTIATENILSRQNLMMQGILASQQATGIIGSAFGTLAGINQSAYNVAQQQQALAAQYLGPQIDVAGMYGQTLGALSEYQVTPGQSLTQIGANLYGSGVQTGIEEIESNLAQKMSYFSGGLNLGSDAYGAQMQLKAAKIQASATKSAGQSAMIGSIGGGALGAAGMVGGALII